ncbi:MAG TPA: hypothetical protein VF457_15945 [Burkholderiaceae bacterium]
MMTSFGKCGGATVRVNYAPGLERQADWLLSVLGEMASSGARLAPDVRVQIGWSFIQLRADGDELIVCEPDFAGNPFKDLRRDVSVTLQVQASQNDFISRLGVAPTMVSFQDKIIFSKGCLGVDRIYAERIDPKVNSHDSGWFFGYVDGDNDASNLQAGYVYHLLALRPILLQILLLPAGYMVVFNGERVEDILGVDGKSVLSARKSRGS